MMDVPFLERDEGGSEGALMLMAAYIDIHGRPCPHPESNSAPFGAHLASIRIPRDESRGNQTRSLSGSLRPRSVEMGHAAGHQSMSKPAAHDLVSWAYLREPVSFRMWSTTRPSFRRYFWLWVVSKWIRSGEVRREVNHVIVKRLFKNAWTHWKGHPWGGCCVYPRSACARGVVLAPIMLEIGAKTCLIMLVLALIYGLVRTKTLSLKGCLAYGECFHARETYCTTPGEGQAAADGRFIAGRVYCHLWSATGGPKPFLCARSSTGNRIRFFQLTGTYRGSLAEQLQNFADAWQHTFGQAVPRPASWHNAFRFMRSALEDQLKRGRRTHRALF